MDIHDLLASDVKIVDASLRQVGDGGVALGFPEHLLPDKRPFSMTYPELTPAVLRDWCNRVRGEWDARQNRKEAEKVGRPAVHGAGGVGTSPGPDQPGSSGGSAAGDGEAGETGLEDSLQSEVARWARREREAAEEVAALHARLDTARSRLDAACANKLKAERVLAFYFEQEQEKEEL